MPNHSPLSRHFGGSGVDDLADLDEVLLGVGFDLFRREAGARLVAAAGVADEGGVVADDEDGLVAEFLEQAQLAQRDGMAEMDVDAGGVDAVLDAQRLAGLDAAFELAAQVGFRRDLLGAAADQFQLFIDGLHGARSLSFAAGAGQASVGPGRRQVALNDAHDFLAPDQGDDDIVGVFAAEHLIEIVAAEPHPMAANRHRRPVLEDHHEGARSLGRGRKVLALDDKLSEHPRPHFACADRHGTGASSTNRPGAGSGCRPEAVCPCVSLSAAEVPGR